ncbi:MAG TPA: carbamate kinase [Candidatus Bipolaricaulota bacterium]
MNKQRVVVALGGNAILQPGQKGTYLEQYANVDRTCDQLARMVLGGQYQLMITHGNGPQVGNILLQNELAKETVSPMPLDVCGAQSQGFIGYMMQQSLYNHFVTANQRNIPVVTLVTQVLVDAKDPAFAHPSKPVGPFYTQAQAKQLQQEKGYAMKEDAGRGWRRVVPSPHPKGISEKEAILALLKAGTVVVTSGGGGIPVVEKAGKLVGVEAVIDKDRSAEVLAEAVGADALLILTDVPQVKLHYKKPQEQALSKVTVAQAQQYVSEGHFAAGSMGPKVEAAVAFAKRGKRAIVASLDQALDALEGKAGTTFVKQ